MSIIKSQGLQLAIANSYGTQFTISALSNATEEIGRAHV